ncbi:unnamed protein product [Dovyalis caffra]|uniref:Uncharacterized protein n=1 Tax=Dovyalis caffra TaxID=77055 RepID=A0AAV1QR75_9ROSI|nr:unnamed protein product [Dovyalis caffra]
MATYAWTAFMITGRCRVLIAWMSNKASPSPMMKMLKRMMPKRVFQVMMEDVKKDNKASPSAMIKGCCQKDCFM